MKIDLPMTSLDCIFGHKAEITLKNGEKIVGVGEYLGESPVFDDSDEDAQSLCFLFENGDGIILFEDEIQSYKLLD